MELKNISYQKIISDISINFEEGKIYSIISSSNEEKEVLGKIISGIITKYDGKITNTYKEKNIQYCYKNPNDMFIKNSVIEELSINLKDNNIEKITKKCIDTLKIVGLNDDYLNRNISTLSASEKKLLSLGLLLISNPKVLVLDEPFLYLDSINKKKIIKLLKKITTRYNKIIIILTNNLLDFYDICDEFILLKNGKVFEKGSKKELLNISDKIEKVGVEVPNIIEFIKFVEKKKNIHLDTTFDIKELMKDIYRNVK